MNINLILENKYTILFLIKNKKIALPQNEIGFLFQNNLITKKIFILVINFKRNFLNLSFM